MDDLQRELFQRDFDDHCQKVSRVTIREGFVESLEFQDIG